MNDWFLRFLSLAFPFGDTPVGRVPPAELRRQPSTPMGGGSLEHTVLSCAVCICSQIYALPFLPCFVVSYLVSRRYLLRQFMLLMGTVLLVAASFRAAAEAAGGPAVALSNLGFSVLLAIVLPVLIICER